MEVELHGIVKHNSKFLRKKSILGSYETFIKIKSL